jgi:hypothetical protein
MSRDLVRADLERGNWVQEETGTRGTRGRGWGSRPRCRRGGAAPARHVRGAAGPGVEDGRRLPAALLHGLELLVASSREGNGSGFGKVDVGCLAGDDFHPKLHVVARHGWDHALQRAGGLFQTRGLRFSPPRGLRQVQVRLRRRTRHDRRQRHPAAVGHVAARTTTTEPCVAVAENAERSLVGPWASSCTS